MTRGSWKIKREVARLLDQARGLSAPAIGRLRRWRHDRNSDLRGQARAGKLPLRGNVAVVLLYQPGGIQRSFLSQLDHLRDNGLAPLVVANHPLTGQELADVLDRSAFVLQRSNVGYDFGGYRDGVRLLRDLGARPDNLLLVNDSIWFPLRAGCSLLKEALAAPEDVFGIFINVKSRRPSHHHLQSYFYRFGCRVLADERFWRLWQSMPLHDDKRLVVRTGEVLLTGRLAAMGFSIGARYRPDDIVAATRDLSDAQIIDVARFHAATTDRGRSIFAPVLADPAPGLADRVRVRMADSRFRYYFIDAHPAIFLGVLQSPFIKKSREPHFVAQRDVIRTDGYLEGLRPEIRAEIETWDDGRRSLASEELV